MTMEESISQLATRLRAQLLDIERTIRAMPDNHIFCEDQAFVGQHEEMIEQCKIALRHIEDARMRLVKVLQYGRDGVSIYDRKEQP